jgi:hypothetical protein
LAKRQHELKKENEEKDAKIAHLEAELMRMQNQVDPQESDGALQKKRDGDTIPDDGMDGIFGGTGTLLLPNLIHI